MCVVMETREVKCYECEGTGRSPHDWYEWLPCPYCWCGVDLAVLPVKDRPTRSMPERSTEDERVAVCRAVGSTDDSRLLGLLGDAHDRREVPYEHRCIQGGQLA